MRRLISLVITGFVLITAQRTVAAERTPEETVKNYLTAVKAGNFADAYQYISKSMARNKTKDDWVKEQQWVMQMAEAKIFEFKVYPSKVQGEKAFVPNVLSSQDKYLNQLGVEEQELYTLIREDGSWKISQQEIVEREDLDKWFPPGASAPK